MEEIPFKVKTLSQEEVSRECARLEEIVRNDNFEPDCILAILNGGKHISENMFKLKPKESVFIQRSSTTSLKNGIKGKILSTILKRLPIYLKDYLRIREAMFLARKNFKTPNESKIDIPDLGKYRKILIVDDAVDSGRTLKKVRDSIHSLYPQAEIRTAVLTVTQPKPLAMPEYTIYNNSTLIRFPWALDF